MAQRRFMSCVLAFAMFVACGRVASDSGGETNWLRCSVDEDCPADSTCVAGRCTETSPPGGPASTLPGASGVALGVCPPESPVATTDISESNIEHSLVKITGEPGGTLGPATAIVGDLDADGYDDFVVLDFGGSGPERSLEVQARGAAYLFYGRERFEGQPSSGGQGGASGNAGDGGMPGDGGATSGEGGAGGLPQQFPEPPVAIAVADADLIVRGADESVSGLGDINGDGHDDFAFVTDCDSEECDGALNGVHVLYGGPERLSGEWRANEIGSQWVGPGTASRVSRAGNVNDDEYADLLVEATLGEDQVTYLLLGREQPLHEALPNGAYDAVFAGDAIAMRSGSTGTGDVDDDGYDDVLVSVGDPQSCRPGGVALFYGGADRFSGTLSPGQADASFTGQSVWFVMGAIGDLDGDGFDDMALPSQLLSVAGFVPIIYGRRARFSGAYEIEQVMDFPVQPLASVDGMAAGDLDGDGRPELLLGDSKDDSGGFQAGTLSVVPGSTERFSGSFKISPANALLQGGSQGSRNDLLGYGTSSGGDINRDGHDDALVSAIGNGYGNGSVLLILSAP